MIKGKIRHQLFLPIDLSKRLTAMAKAQKRPRSELLLDAVETWLGQRTAPSVDDRIAARLDRIARETHSNARHQMILGETVNWLVRQRLLDIAALPAPSPEVQAVAERRYQAYLDRLAERLALGAENDNAASEQAQSASG
jgi:predicted transcriptional regulator